MIRVDDSVVAALVTTQLMTAGVSGEMLVLLPGEPDPTAGGESDGAGAGDRPLMWCRLVAIDVRQRPRTRRADEPDMADVVVSINVFANRAATLRTPTAIYRAGALVESAMGEETLREGGVGGVHQIDLRQTDFSADAQADEQRGIATGVVMIEGIASRTSGETLLAYGPTPVITHAILRVGAGELVLVLDGPVRAGVSVAGAAGTRGAVGRWVNDTAAAFAQGSTVTLPVVEQSLDVGASRAEYTGAGATYLVGLNGVAVAAGTNIALTVE